MLRISVIIPVFNSQKYLDKCINSVIKQNFDDVEIICINDGSTDNSLDILNKYAKIDDRVKVYTKKNEGPGCARNYGIKHASGEYVLFLDSDDYLEDTSLEKLYNTAICNKSEIVLFNGIEHYKNNVTNKRIYNVHIKDKDVIESFSFDYNNNVNLVMNGYHIVCTKLHSLDFIKKYDLKFSDKGKFEDILFHIKTMIYAKRISYNPNIFYHYNRFDEDSRQNNSISSKSSFVLFDIFNQTRQLLVKENLFDKLRINYYKFVINESMNIFNNIKAEYKYELFIKTKNTFKLLNIPIEYEYRLPFDQQVFYLSILKSDNIDKVTKFERIIKIKLKSKLFLIKIKNKLL